MEDYEKKYKNALEWARRVINGEVGFVRNEVEEEIFPELKESEDDKIRKEIISFLRSKSGYGYMNPDEDWNFNNRWLPWLEKQSDKDKLIKELGEYKVRYTQEVLSQQIEKQDKIDKESYDIAEKEKYDFVSGHFIECRKSFDVFKEDNSYWFEYVGNDNYIGRSDNILNQKFHITPRQLYCLFTQEHCPKEDNANAPIEYGKYVDECLNDASEHFFSEGEDKYSVADLFYAGVRCGKSWFEKQGTSAKLSEEEQNRDAKVVLTSCALSFIDYLDAHKYEGKMCVSNGECEDIENAFHNAMWDRLHRYYCKYIEKQGEQKPILDFKASNWYVSKVDGKIHDLTYNPTNKIEPKFKVGDWVVRGDTIAQILDIQEQYYVGLDINGKDFTSSRFLNDDKIHLWTIKDAKDGDVVVDKSDGTIGIFQSIGHHPDGGSCNDPSYCFLHCRYDDGYFYADFENGNTVSSEDVIPATKEQRDLLFQKMKEAGYEWDAEKLELKKIEEDGVEYKKHIISELVNLAITGVKQKSESVWSEEDEKMCQETIDWFEKKCFPYALESENPARESIKWLKSLKGRITWKPSKEQMDALLGIMIESGFDYIDYNTLESLYNDLKKL